MHFPPSSRFDYSSGRNCCYQLGIELATAVAGRTPASANTVMDYYKCYIDFNLNSTEASPSFWERMHCCLGSALKYLQVGKSTVASGRTLESFQHLVVIFGPCQLGCYRHLCFEKPLDYNYSASMVDKYFTDYSKDKKLQMRNSSSEPTVIIGANIKIDFGEYVADNSISNSFGCSPYCCFTIDYGSSNSCSNDLG